MSNTSLLAIAGRQGTTQPPEAEAYNRSDAHSEPLCKTVGGVAQWLGRRSLTGELSLIYA